MNAHDPIAVTGLGLELPGLEDAAGLLEFRAPAEPAPFDARRKLGKKGLLYKDQATRLALCAAQDALVSAGWPVRELHSQVHAGVVAASNFGNLDTVCRVIDTLKAGGAGELSPMDVPNASSNVIASSAAIRFGCRAVNLMLCSGAASGLEALVVAANVLRAGRAECVLVIGVEPDTEHVRRLTSTRGADGVRLGSGAACVVLEPLSRAQGRGVTARALVGDYAAFALDAARPAPRRPDVWLTPNLAWPALRPLADAWRRAWEAPAPDEIDLSASLGEVYGALGVLQCVAAALRFARPGAAPAERALLSAGGSWGDGVAHLALTAPPRHP